MVLSIRAANVRHGSISALGLGAENGHGPVGRKAVAADVSEGRLADFVGVVWDRKCSNADQTISGDPAAEPHRAGLTPLILCELAFSSRSNSIYRCWFT